MKRRKILGIEFEEEDEGVLFCHILLMKKRKIGLSSIWTKKMKDLILFVSYCFIEGVGLQQ